MNENCLSQNINALKYSLSITDEIKAMTNCLNSYLGIDAFNYLRVYKDGRYLHLMNGYEEYQKLFFSQISDVGSNFKNSHNKVFSQNNREINYIWNISQFKNSTIKSLLKDFKFYEGCTFMNSSSNAVEIISYAYALSDTSKSSEYLKNHNLLKMFCSFFRGKAQDLINCDDSKLAIFENYQDSEDFEENHNDIEFLNLISKNKLIILNSRNRIVELSPKESICMYYYSRSKTSKEIAEITGNTFKTIETIITHVKFKTGYNLKSELVDAFDRSRLYNENFTF